MTDNSSSDDRDSQAWSFDGVSALASAVISALNDKSDQTSLTPRASMVKKLVDATLRQGTFTSEHVLADLRGNRLPDTQILDLYIPEAARALGEMWLADDISFADVTIASGRLQGLLTLLSPPWSGDAENEAMDRLAMLVLTSSNSHTLGPHVLAAQFRRLGVSVRIVFDGTPDDIVAAVRDTGCDLILFSCARPEDLAGIGEIITRLRRSPEHLPPVVVGGQVLSMVDGVKDLTGADLVTNDYRVAHKLCEPATRSKSPLGRR